MHEAGLTVKQSRVRATQAARSKAPANRARAALGDRYLAMATLGIDQVFTSYDNPKGNADTERLMRTIREELLWLREFRSLEEARTAIAPWITVEYNQRYVHSALGYQSPLEFEARLRREGPSGCVGGLALSASESVLTNGGITTKGGFNG